MLTRRPAPRPLDVMALEVLLTVACAVQVGLLLWLAVATWDDRGVPGVVLGVLVVVALAVGGGWLLWLLGVHGWLLAGASGVAGLEVSLLLVLALGGGITGVSTGALLLSLGAAVLGVLCGIFLPAPSSRRHALAPRVRDSAGGPPAAARVSPGVAAAVDRYGRSVAGGVAVVTAAGARRLNRGGEPAATTPATTDDAAEGAARATVMQPRPGTPIRTSGPVDRDVARSPAGSSAPGELPEPGAANAAPGARSPAPIAATPSAASGTPASGTPASGTPASGTPASGTPSPSRTTPSRLTNPPPDPGVIARQARASIDAELARPRPPARPPSSPDGGPGGAPR